MRRWFRRLCFGKWNENRLLSRKWWLVASTIPVVVVLDALGRPLGEHTLGFLQTVIVAYLGVQGILDWRSATKASTIIKEDDV